MIDELHSMLKRAMGGSSSRPGKPRGCWSLRPQCSIEDEQKKEEKAKEKTKNKLKLKLRSNTSTSQKSQRSCNWDEIPTPSVVDCREHSSSMTSQERVAQIISCFPYPSQEEAPLERQQTTSSIGSQPQQPFNSFSLSNAFEKFVHVSVETMAITALPMDVWLKERLKKWVQLSGHEGSIVPASPHTLYKKQSANCSEARAYEGISKDPCLNGMAPKYYKELRKNDESFIEIEDLLQQFNDPAKVAIMDIKIGTRTFLESEVSNAKKRNDLYEKMVAIDPEEPTEEEKLEKAITKLRYMQFRERESSSAQLGFRIEAAKMPGGCLEKNFKKVRTSDDVTRTLMDFFSGDRARLREELLNRLKRMRESIEKSHFFSTHEVVGSSLLLVYDEDRVGCWMIDFAKSSRLSNGRTVDHRSAWIPGNNEDGYLTGIDNIIQIMEDMPSTDVFPVDDCC